MLLLLRKVRKKLMKENKVTTYLLYAIGEIVLVVIGILIAVSLNNWNQANKAASGQRILLEEVLEALKQDSIASEQTMVTTENIYNLYQKLHHVRLGKIPGDSLNNLQGLRRSNNRIIISILNYPDLATRVADQALKTKVQAYYGIVRNWQFVQANYNDFIENNMRAKLREHQLLSYGYFYQKPYEQNHLFTNDMINRDRLIEKLEDEDLQQIFFEGVVKTRNFRGFISPLREARAELQNEIYRVLQSL